eukprot:1541363-Rhodomonas_salina.3
MTIPDIAEHAHRLVAAYAMPIPDIAYAPGDHHTVSQYRASRIGAYTDSVASYAMSRPYNRTTRHSGGGS